MEIDTEELKSFAPIIPYIEQHYSKQLPIIKKGKNVVFTQCLWHEEKTASLAFFANGTYKCFGGGCGAHGDVITLVQHMENVTFQEACKMIGDNVGYEVILEEPNPVFENYKNMLDEYTRRYWCNLQRNGEALKYLLFERKISKEMIDTFRLGLTDPEEYRFRTDIGGISNRIVFPILEHKRKQPKCVGMAYRGFTNEQPKYINDANQDGREGQNPALAGVFTKGNMLYGLPLAYDGIKQQKHIILVEGYFDVISLHQSGITNAVGVMGTAITEAQIETICKYTKNVLLLLDGDNAGINAMMKNIGALYQADLNVAVCVLEGNMDPDSLCKSFEFDGRSISSYIKNHTKQGIEFIVNKAVERYENVASTERLKAIRTAMPIINSVQNEDVKELYKHTLYKRLNIT